MAAQRRSKLHTPSAAACVGPVTAAAFELWGVPTIVPERSRLAGMVKQLESELPTRRDGADVRLTRAAIGTNAVLTVVKRGYRLAVG